MADELLSADPAAGLTSGSDELLSPDPSAGLTRPRPAPMVAQGITDPASVRVTNPTPSPATRTSRDEFGVSSPALPHGEGALGRVLTIVPEGAMQAAQGLSNVPGVPMVPVPAPYGGLPKDFGDRYANAVSDITEGLIKASTPLMVAGAVSAPLATATALVTSIAGDKLGSNAARVAGASPAGQRLAGNLTALLTGGVMAPAIIDKVRADVHALVSEVRAYDAAHPDAPAPGVKPVGRGATDAAKAAKPQLPEEAVPQPPTPEAPTPQAPTPPAQRAPLETVVGDLARATESGDITARKTALAELATRGIDAEEADARATALAPPTPPAPQAQKPPDLNAAGQPVAPDVGQELLSPEPSAGLEKPAVAPEPAPEAPQVQPAEPTPGPAPVAQPEPWQMTRAEFTRQENQPKVEAIQSAIRQGKPIVLATNARATQLSSPSQIRIMGSGTVQIPEGRGWVSLTAPQVDALAAQAGVPPVPLESRVYHASAVEDAHAAGLPVPAHVLAEYPALAAKPTEEENVPRGNAVQPEDQGAPVAGEVGQGDRHERAPADEGGALPSGRQGNRVPRRRVPSDAVAYKGLTFERRGPRTNVKRLTPDVRRELIRMADEMDAFPFVKATYNDLSHEAGLEGNFAGGHMEKVGRSAGAAVYDDILEHAPLAKPKKGKDGKKHVAREVAATRADVERAIRRVIQSNDIHSHIAEGAVQIAERRAAGKWYGISKPWLPHKDETPVDDAAVDAVMDEGLAHEDEGDISFDPAEFEAQSAEQQVEKPYNPFRAKADRARAAYERVSGTSAHDAGMAQAFPLGAGYGRKGGDRRVEARITQGVKAVELHREATYLEAQAKAFDEGKINAQGRRVDAASKVRSEKRARGDASREERQATAREEIGDKQRWQVPGSVWADAAGYFGGSGRQLILGDHRDAVEAALVKGEDVPADVLADYPDLAPPPADVNEHGEAQARLPEAGQVREQEHATPTFEAPFSLTGEAAETKAVEPSLFGDEKPQFSKRQSHVGTPALQAWFKDSKVVDEHGEPLVVYHGTSRGDRVGNRFRKTRATSGPMAFFTTDREIANKYASGKQDTSLEQPADYGGWFKFKPKGSRSTVDLDRAWWHLTPEQRATASAKLFTTGYANPSEGDGPIVGDSQSIGGDGHTAYELKAARGNALTAAKEIWLNSGSLFGDEEKFLDVLKGMGLGDLFTYDSPHRTEPKVYAVHLSIQKPLVTSAIPQAVVDALDKRARRQRPAVTHGADAWDKRTRDARDWMTTLKDDLSAGRNSHAWSSIPDWVTATLKEFGYDGIHDTGGKNGGVEHDVWIPFDDRQVKSATDNRGTFDPTKADIRFSKREEAPVFYSALTRSAEALPQAKGTPDQMLAMLQKAKGVKAEEVAWSGIEPWLKAQTGSVTKQAIVDYLKANELQVSETTLGDDRLTADEFERYKGMNKRLMAGHVLDDSEREEYGRLQKLNGEFEPTKFANYQLPGGAGYRELLIQLPVKRTWINGDPITAEDVATPHGRETAERVGLLGDNTFTSGHFDQPNVVAHVRFNDRTDADGQRVLFIEEVQSDWHQKGRKQGYATPVDQSLVAAKDKAHARYQRLQGLVSHGLERADNLGFNTNGSAVRAVRDDPSWPWPNQGLPEELEESIKELRAAWAEYGAASDALTAHAGDSKRVPDAPFKTTWPELAMKRMVRYAAEQGYDRLAWTTGDQQNARYDLSKQVGKVQWHEGDQFLSAWNLELSDPVLEKSGVTKDNLADYVGKEVAERLANQEPNEDGDREISGDGLRIGGSGMKGFYDKILPTYMNKFGKPFGAKVGQVTFDLSGMDSPTQNTTPATGRWVAWPGGRENELHVFNDETSAHMYADLHNGDYAPQREPLVAHAIDITLEMRATALQGLPLFQRGIPQLGPEGSRTGAQRTAQQAVYDGLPTRTVAGTPVTIYDEGERFTPEELDALLKRDGVRHALSAIDRVLVDASAKLAQSGGAHASTTIERRGLMTMWNVYGVYLPNLTDGGKATILINPFEHLRDATHPSAAADATVMTIVHELTHAEVSHHGHAFEDALAANLARLGDHFIAQAKARIMEAYADPTHRRALHPDLARSLSDYRASRGRPERTRNDLAGAPSRRQGRPDDASGPSESPESPGRRRRGPDLAAETGAIRASVLVPESVADIAREVRNTIAPQSASPEAQRTADVVRNAKAKARNLATFEAIKHRDVVKAFDRRTDAENIAAISEYERTGTFPDAPAGYSTFYQQSMATARTLLQNAYGDDAVGYIENYVRRAFVFGSKAQEAKGTTVLQQFARTLAANRSPTKSRVLDMPLDEALALMQEKGIAVKMQTTNPERLRQWSLANARQASAYRQAWESLKEGGFVHFAKIGDRIPEGLEAVSEQGARFFYPKERGLGQYYATPDVARVLDNATSKGLGGSPTFRGLRAVNNGLNQFQLGLSAFHLTGTAVNAMVADVALGVRQALRGEAAGVVRIARGLTPGASFVRDVYRGHQFLEDLKNDSPEAWAAMGRWINPSGARLQMDQRYETAAIGKMKAAWREGHIASAAIRVPWALLEAVSAPLMEFAIPRVKIAVALERMADVQKRMPDATPEQLHRAYAATADQIDNMFGLMVYDNGFWNKTAQDLAQLATRSVGWTGGTLRWGVGAAADLPKAFGAGGGKPPVSPTSGGTEGAEPDGARGPEVSDRLLDALILPIVVGLIGAAYTYLHTRKRPQSAKDYFYPLNGRTEANGHPSRTSLPTYMKDVYAYSQDPVGTLLHKQSPLLELGSALYENEDYWRSMIRDPHDPVSTQLADTGRFLWKEIQPFSLQTGGIEPFFGFTKAAVRVTETPAERYLHDAVPPGHFTKAQAERAARRRDVRALLENGRQDEAMAAARAAGLTPASIRALERSVRQGRLVGQFSRATWEDAVQAYKLASPEERSVVRPTLLSKFANTMGRSGGSDERSAIAAQRDALMRLPVQDQRATSGAIP